MMLIGGVGAISFLGSLRAVWLLDMSKQKTWKEYSSPEIDYTIVVTFSFFRYKESTHSSLRASISTPSRRLFSPVASHSSYVCLAVSRLAWIAGVCSFWRRKEPVLGHVTSTFSLIGVDS